MRTVYRCCFALCLLTILAPVVLAETPLNVALGVDSLAFETSFNYGDAYVSVSGPDGFVESSRVTEGGALSLSLGKLLGDGLYTWKVVLVEPLDLEQRPSRGGRTPTELDVETRTFTGTFRVRDGVAQGPSTGAPGDDRDVATKDQVFLDDLVVTGSGCFGFDCEDGESFGFDTLRLHENNVRLKFLDSSSDTGTFPNNDWTLVANDSNSNGLEHFSIYDDSAGRYPFRVLAGASSNALVIDGQGDIGLGTLSPAEDLHIVTGDSPTLRLEQDGSAGFGAQTWDIAANETNFFIRDLTAGSTLPFRIFRDAPDDAFTINSDGDIGINTANTPGRLSIRDTAGGNSDLIYLENNGKITIRTSNTGAGAIWDFSNDGSFNISRVGSGVNEFRLNDAGNLTILGSLIAFGGDGSNDPGDTFPDYVFEPDYDLMSIEALEAFIDQNRHLPNVPSASDISAAGGINMTELQLRLLEKVEELTLYTIAQQRLLDSQTALTQKIIDAQAEENRRLKDRLRALEAE